MKAKATVTTFLFLVIGIAASAWAQGDLAQKGKALVETKKCAICHKEGGLGMPLEKLAGTSTDEHIKEVITDPKKAIGPQAKMSAFKLSGEELQAVVAYLRSIAKP